MYRKYLFISFFCLVLILFQTSFFPEIFGIFLNPNFILAFVFSLLFLGKTEEAFFTAFIGGLLIDLLGSSVIGLSPFILVISALFTQLTKRFVMNNLFSQSVLLLSSSIVYIIALNFPKKILFAGTLWGSFLTLALSFAFYLIIKGFFHERKYL